MFTRIRATYAEIRLSNLAHNFRFLRSCVESKSTKAETFICPMIKANAYGHGDIQCARVLSQAGVHNFGVVLVEEGIRLREAGIGGNILVFGTFQRDAAGESIKYALTPVISRWNDIKELESQVPAGTTHPVHLKFNTGMNRMGFDQEDAPDLADWFKKNNRLVLSGICTHLSNGEDSANREGKSSGQITRLEELSVHFDTQSLIVHALNSSAICLKAFSDLGVRPGIALYGSRPALPDSNLKLDIRPVMSVKSRIEHIQSVAMDQNVSYGETWTAKRESVIGIVPIGYADGYPRAASNKSHMLLRGKRVPVVGVVCMDYTMLDLTDLHANHPIEIGEEVVIIGNQKKESYSADELAKVCNTISYEILTGISARVPRVYLHEGQ